jgi:CheY-like chemotaxis protein
MPSPYILMLEDDPDDRFFTTSVVSEMEQPVPIRFLSNSADLFTTLRESEPLVILIDFNLNPENGLDILKRLKSDPRFRHIPVVLLGDSTDPHFITTCYLNGANTYAVKPTTLEATRKKIGLFFQYWLEVAETTVRDTATALES